MRQIHPSAWLLVLLSAGLQILIFPLPNLYVLSWIALTPLLVALLRTRTPETLQLSEGRKWLPARPLQAFLLAYVCGILWWAGTCYWIYITMRQYGGLNVPAALGFFFLLCLYLALYHGAFGLAISLLAGDSPLSRRALVLAPVVWVAVELARTRISGVPWNLLGVSQADNIPLARIATVTGVYGLSFEIMLVNAAFATAILVRRQKRRQLLLASIAAAVILQAARWIPVPAPPSDKAAYLVQENVPVQEEWTRPYFMNTLHDLTRISLNPGSAVAPAAEGKNRGGQLRPDLIAWPESPAPFYTNDPGFRDTLSEMARQSNAWVLAGSLRVRSTPQNAQRPSEIYNSAALVSPAGEWASGYDKSHLVPFGEYVPFKDLFSFAGGLTKEVGDFSRGQSRAPLDAGETKLGVFICYESVFPDEVRQFAARGAQVFVNISNDGWYGDSGAYAQHLKQVRMRAIENSRWLLRATNTGVTASIDPYGRIVARLPRKVRATLVAPYALSNETTLYTRYGDWLACLCAIISVAALLMPPLFRRRTDT